MKRLVLLLLLLLAFALRIHNLDAFSFWQDEGLTPLRSSLSIADILSNEVVIQEAVSQDTHPPLYFLLIHFTRTLFGESDFAYRYPSLLAGLLLIPLLYQFGRAIAGEKVALIAALLAAVNPLFIWFSQEARMYTMVVLFATAASYALWRGMKDRQTLRWLLLYLLFAAMAFLTHYTAALLIAIQSLFWIYLLWSRGHRLLILGAGVIGMLILIPFIPYTVPRLFTGAETNYFYVSPLIMLQDVVHGFGLGNTAPLSQPLIILIDLIAAAVIVLGFYGAYRQSKSWLLPVFLLVYLLAVVLGLALGSLIKPMYQGVRHIIAGSSAFILLVSIGVTAMPRQPRWAPSAALALLILGPLISLNNLYNNPRYAKDDVRALVAYIEERAGENDVVLYNNAILLSSHHHYAERADLPAAALPVYPHIADENTLSDLAVLAEEYDRIWFVIDPPADGRDRQRMVENWLQDNLLMIDRENKHARSIKVQVDAYSTEPFLYDVPPEGINLVESARGSQLQLHGWTADFSQPAFMTNLWFDLYWSNPGSVSQDDQIRITLQDQQGQIWFERNRPFWTWDQELNSVLEANQEAGSDVSRAVVRLSYDLEIPYGTPPGDYSLSLLRWNKEGSDFPAEPLFLGDISIGASGDRLELRDQPFDTSSSVIFRNGYKLEGLANTTAEVRPGHSLPVFLYWSSSAFVPDAVYELELVGPDKQVWDQYASSPGPDWLSSEAWSRDSTIREIVGLSFPADAPSGSYHLRWRMLEDGAPVPGRPSWRPWSGEWIRFGSIDLHPWPIVTDLPEVDTIVNARFGDDIKLHGFDLEGELTSPGESIDLTLYWKALNKPEANYLVFVHLISPEDETIVSQIDRFPVDWLRPTAGWRADEIIVDHYSLPVPGDLPPGDYLLFTGLFDPDTGLRPQVLIDEIQQPDNRLQLPIITVREQP